MKELCELLRELRNDHDLTQKAFAAYLGISQQAYSNYENGYREIPIRAVTALAKYYCVSADYLLGTSTFYFGATKFKNPYLPEITMQEFLYDIQTLNKKSRRQLLFFIQFLKYLQKLQ